MILKQLPSDNNEIPLPPLRRPISLLASAAAVQVPINNDDRQQFDTEQMEVVDPRALGPTQKYVVKVGLFS